ncbi:hypothetical protein FIU87_13215 [Bacillus sp. THAF10]|uniref:hypothetical protein n=1 Tax=Bacillus sp. THAF10 TaxID=2587848 RepID=UPI0012697E3C|nr:hypothetical protein [Bacillus sp. THAF10]QFT89614.1 hypothetical protein FIU87_13215 [Bacillus sp. THAF10]
MVEMEDDEWRYLVGDGSMVETLAGIKRQGGDPTSEAEEAPHRPSGRIAIGENQQRCWTKPLT